jgi:hypothetical protein
VIERLPIAVEPAQAALHKNILLDLRDTQGTLDYAEMVRVIAEFRDKFSNFKNRIAVLMPNIDVRLQKADFTKSGISSRDLNSKSSRTMKRLSIGLRKSTPFQPSPPRHLFQVRKDRFVAPIPALSLTSR